MVRVLINRIVVSVVTHKRGEWGIVKTRTGPDRTKNGRYRAPYPKHCAP